MDMPLINGILCRCPEDEFITSFGHKDEFWRITLDANSNKKMELTLPGRPLYQFVVMPDYVQANG